MAITICSTYSSLDALDKLRKGKAHIAIYLSRIYCSSSNISSKLLLDPKFSKGLPVEGFSGEVLEYSGDDVYEKILELLNN